MMKRILLLLVLLSTSLLIAQKSTQRKVILENFTTAACPNCPPIHTLLENYVESHPNAILIAQHAGYYTDPMTIPENTELLALYNDGGSTYAPGLCIDRYHYPTGLTGGAADPGPVFWPGESTSATISRINDRLAIPANISLDVSVQNNSGVLTIDVSGEILETVAGNDLRLVVYLKEDGIISNQSGGSTNYTHNNVMRDAVSGTWGDAGVITSNTAGTTFSKQYIYTLDTNWNSENMSLVAFVANYNGNVNDREILQAEALTLATPEGTNNVDVQEVEVYDSCNRVSVDFNVRNAGAADITEMEIAYTVNGAAGADPIMWNGLISFNETQSIFIDDIVPEEILENNTIDFEITQVNGVVDDDTSNNLASSTFDLAPELPDNYLRIYIRTDGSGNEVTWALRDGDGNTVASGGPYANNETINEYPSLLHGCYTFDLNDSGGDGGSTVALIDSGSNTIFYDNGSGYSNGIIQDVFSYDPDSMSIDEGVFNQVSIYPNPAKDMFNVNNAEGLNMAMYDVMGRKVFEKLALSAQENLQLSEVAEGTYFIHLTDGQNVRVEKIVIRR